MSDFSESRVDLEAFDTFMLDIDGVIWNLNEPIPGSVDTINTLHR